MADNDFRRSRYFLTHKDGFYIDDITANDIGIEDVFLKIDKTRSSLGEEILYHMIRTPLFDEGALKKREEEIVRYSSADDGLKKTKAALSKLSKLKKISVFEYLDHLNNVKKINKTLLFIPALLILTGMIVTFFDATVGIILLLLSFIVNTVRYFGLLKDTRPFLSCFSYVFRAIGLSGEIKGVEPEEYKSLLGMTHGNFILGNLSGVTANGGGGNPFDLLLDLIRMSTHADIIRFYFLTDKVLKNKDKIVSLLEHIGYIDSYISIAELRNDFKTYAIPKFIDDKHIICEGLYHLLLNDPVPNSIDTTKSILITGSNASGKSTFLRSLALSILFSQTLHTVPASSYKAPICRLITSMSLTDDLLGNESFYMAEIKSVKRISKWSEYDGYVCCFVDELLKGTNTVERIAASSVILKDLDAQKRFCFAATHDRELTKILDDTYENRHFDEKIDENGDIGFSYMIKPGAASTTNAIVLLHSIGFDEKITDDASAMVKRFENDGIWELP
ncbi:MAG: hypothetical protein K6A38_09410 [Lachnospiraceae bacterium]|nr:hypothetical protein [Lachnospiraceae bacterium]